MREKNGCCNPDTQINHARTDALCACLIYGFRVLFHIDRATRSLSAICSQGELLARLSEAMADTALQEVQRSN